MQPQFEKHSSPPLECDELMMFLSPKSARRERKEFVYPGKPLQQDEIRLVKLQPGAWSDTIVCALTNVPLENAHYRALSYVWGSQRVTRDIRLDGHMYPVTVNLESALRHLREQYKNGLILWVDALCIHQKDDKERAEQVQLMNWIYRECQEGIVYLGDRLDGTTSASSDPPEVLRFDRHTIAPLLCSHSTERPGVYEIFSFFQELSHGKHLSEITLLGNDWNLSTSTRREKPQNRLELFEAVRRFMHAPFTPWWDRIWVVQEVTAPSVIQVVYGTISAPWSMFVDAAAVYNKHRLNCCLGVVQDLPRDQEKVLTDSCNRIDDVGKLSKIRHAHLYGKLNDNVNQHANTSLSLLALLRQFRDRKASDPRDKVYALLSMASIPTGRTSLKPDYSLSVADVFRQATLETTYSSGSLSVFSTELGRKFRNDLPSWVPDWSAPGGQTYSLRADSIELYNACPGTKATPYTVVLSTNTSISVQGLEKGSVKTVGEVMWGDSAQDCRATLLNWWDLIGTEAIQEDTSVRHRTADFWNLISANVIRSDQHNTRRMQPEDELIFIIWSMRSKGSPFHSLVNDDTDRSGTRENQFRQTWSLSARIWELVRLLWHGSHVLYPNFQSANILDADYYPTAYKDLHWQAIENSLQYRTCRDMFQAVMVGLGKSPEEVNDFWSDAGLQFVAPWRNLVLDFRKHLVNTYGSGIHLVHEQSSKVLQPIDDSIMAATLSRGLIMCCDYIGLAPAATLVGDEVYLLKGGRTPFILRRTGTTDTTDLIKLSSYEIIGDCYVHGMMDGDPGSEASSWDWQSILLV